MIVEEIRMATKMSDRLSVREGLIQVVSAPRFQSKPRGGANVHVIVMARTGNTLRHYCTLRSDKDTLSIAEQLWGDFVCYVVDLSLRELRIEEEFPTSDRVTSVRVTADIVYRVVDGEQAVIGVEDVLWTLREDLVMLLRQEVSRLPLEQVTEAHLEVCLNQESVRIQSRLGITVDTIRVRVDWPEEVLACRRAVLEQRQTQKAEDEQRRREIVLQEHLDALTERLGLDKLPADVRLRLYALPREEALSQIIARIEEQRAYVREALNRRMEEEYALLRTLIDDGVIEDMDLVDLAKDLLDRYRRSLSVGEALELSPDTLFDDVQRAMINMEEDSEDLQSLLLADTDKPSEKTSDQEDIPKQPSSCTDESAEESTETGHNETNGKSEVTG
jgi:hypothetical protein